MIVVADASVLIGLSAIRQLALLHERFPQGVLIPPAVRREVVDQGGSRPGAQEVEAADWISVQPLKLSAIKQLLSADLEEGEAEAIALAHELGADIILLDERDGRKAAGLLGFSALGTIGILIWARQNGRLSRLDVVLDALQEVGGFRISRSLYEQALQAVGEKPE